MCQEFCSGAGNILPSSLIEDPHNGLSIPRYLVGVGDLDLSGISTADQHSGTLGNLVVPAKMDT